MTIRTLANSALVNSDPKKFGPSQFGPRPLVSSDPDHWSIRTLFNWSIRTSIRKNLWSIRTFSIGQFGPFPFVNSDLFHWSIRTFSFGQFGLFHYLFSTKKTSIRLKRANLASRMRLQFLYWPKNLMHRFNRLILILLSCYKT